MRNCMTADGAAPERTSFSCDRRRQEEEEEEEAETEEEKEKEEVREKGLGTV